MWRFYVIATLIVVGIGSAFFARRVASLRDFSVSATPRPGQTPTQVRGGGNASTRAERFTGEGSWVMSALPDCFDEQRSIVGRSEAVAHLVPPERERIRSGTTLRWSDCEVTVGTDTVVIRRGDDRLRVPPSARLYAASADRLTLVWRGASGRTEIRIYTPPAIAPGGRS
jgi:hypothetical protein